MKINRFILLFVIVTHCQYFVSSIGKSNISGRKENRDQRVVCGINSLEDIYYNCDQVNKSLTSKEPEVKQVDPESEDDSIFKLTTPPTLIDSLLQPDYDAEAVTENNGNIKKLVELITQKGMDLYEDDLAEYDTVLKDMEEKVFKKLDISKADNDKKKGIYLLKEDEITTTPITFKSTTTSITVQSTITTTTTLQPTTTPTLQPTSTPTLQPTTTPTLKSTTTPTLRPTTTLTLIPTTTHTLHTTTTPTLIPTITHTLQPTIITTTTTTKGQEVSLQTTPTSTIESTIQTMPDIVTTKKPIRTRSIKDGDWIPFRTRSRIITPPTKEGDTTYYQDGTASTHIIWDDGPPEKQEVPKETDDSGTVNTTISPNVSRGTKKIVLIIETK